MKKQHKSANVISNATPATIGAKAENMVKSPTLDSDSALKGYYGILSVDTAANDTWESVRTVSHCFAQRKQGKVWSLCMLLMVCHKLTGCNGYTSAIIRHAMPQVIDGFLYKRNGELCAEAKQVTSNDFYTRDGVKVATCDGYKKALRAQYALALLACSDAQLQALLLNVAKPAMTHYLTGTTPENAKRLAMFAKVCTAVNVRAELKKVQAMKTGDVYSL